MEEPVTIVDRDVLKVLSVDTRMDIIKELSQGSRTPSDLSKKLRKSNSTIIEHLDVLVKSGLVKKIEQPGKKWIFYTLTERGHGIIGSKSRRLIIILATSLAAVVGGFFSLSLYTRQTIYAITQAPAEAMQVPEIAKSVSISVTVSPFLLYLSIILFGMGILGLIFYLYQRMRMQV